MQFSTPALVAAIILSVMACNNAGTNANTSDQRTDAASAAPANTTASLPRAKNNDTVWVLVNHVKADKRPQFEHFVHEIFWDSAAKLSASDQQVFRQTRILNPTAPEKDGTYSYIFLMDPYVPGANYDIHYWLNKMYGEPKATEYTKMFDETTTGPQTAYLEVQSRH